MPKFPKTKPNMRKLLKPNNNVILEHKLSCTSWPDTSYLMKPNADFIEGNDRAKIGKYECNVAKCHNLVHFCENAANLLMHMSTKRELLDMKRHHSN